MLLGHVRVFHKMMSATPGSPYIPSPEWIVELTAQVRAEANSDAVVRRAVGLLALVLPPMIEASPGGEEDDSEPVARRWPSGLLPRPRSGSSR